jgi:hypothetical protein
MTVEDIKKEVKKKFRLGQPVNLKIKDNDKPETNTIKVVILSFDTNSVLIERNGFKESYRYWDFLRMTSVIKEEKKVNEKTVYHKNTVAS